MYCQLDNLRRCLPADIKKSLDELPVTLDETYERILLGIDRQKREHAIRLLQCLAFSRRPLRVNEIAEVLATRFDAGQIPRLHKDQRPRKPDEDVLLAGSTLITTIKPGVHSNTRVVQFSHYSVAEFLTSERLARSGNEALSQYYISPESSHTTLAQTCMGTLLQLDNHDNGVTQDFPLAEYAAQNWFYHAQYKDVAPRIQDEMTCLFDPNRKHLTAWVSVHDIDHDPSRTWLSPPEPSPLYYATLCGIRSVVEYLVIACRQDPNKSHGGRGTPLHAAVALGHTAIVQFLLEHEHAAYVNARDKRDSTPLHKASENGNLNVMQLLLSRGADVNVFDHLGDTPLHKALRFQRFDAVKFLVEGGADVNVWDKSNSTPLHEASESGNLDVIQLLLSLGADVNVLDHRGDSALHKASRYQKLDAVDFLVNGGADVNVRDKSDSTPLHEASESGNLNVIQLLLSLGADVNALDHRGDSSLHKASRSQRFNVRDISNSTPLHEASESGNLDVMQLLLSRGADVNVFDHGGGSPLHKASRYQRFDAVKLLVEGGADVNVRDKSDSTPLHEASESGNLDVLQLLLSRDAHVNVFDHRGDSPLHNASRYQRFNAMKLLIKRGADANARDKFNSTPLHEASRSGNLYVMQLLLSLGANINALDHRGDSALHKASRYQRFDAVNLLVDRGADVNVRDKSNSTPLHEASGCRNLGIAQLLLAHGADVDVFDHWGDSPLHKSFRSLTFDIMGSPQRCCVRVIQGTYNKTLTRNNFNLVPRLSRKCTSAMNAWDKGRSTPVFDALQGESYAMTQLLLAHGADVNVRGWRDKTPLDLASFEGSLDVSRLLIEHGADVDAQTPFLIRGHRKLSQLLSNYRFLGTTMAGTSRVKLSALYL